MGKFIKKIGDEFKGKEKIYFRFLKYERFEDIECYQKNLLKSMA